VRAGLRGEGKEKKGAGAKKNIIAIVLDGDSRKRPTPTKKGATEKKGKSLHSVSKKPNGGEKP